MSRVSRWLIGSFLLAGVAGCSQSGSPKPDSPRPNLLQEIQGTYTCIRMEIQGKQVPEKDLEPDSVMYMKYEIRGSKWVWSSAKGNTPPIEFGFDMDETKEPITFDLRRDGKPERHLGLLKHSDGVLTIITSIKDSPRPKGFATQEGEMLWVLKRD